MKKTIYILMGVAAISNFTISSSFADGCEKSFVHCVEHFEAAFKAAAKGPTSINHCALCHSNCQKSLAACVKEKNWRLEGLTHTLIMGCNHACNKTAPSK